jgi:phosphogluconate dehydratase
MMMEFLGLQMPGGSFVNPGTPLRDALTEASVRAVLANTRLAGQENHRPIGKIVDEKAIVNGIVGLLATGGSTNHTLHLVAIARAAGIAVDWTDFSELSAVVPLLARVYPNGVADVNHFHAAGGLGFVMRELLEAGLAHEDVLTFRGRGLSNFLVEPALEDGGVAWRDATSASLDTEILRPVSDAFDAEGGLALVDGNVGRAVVKVSAVNPEHRRISAPARVFRSQEALKAAFQAGELTGDFVAVVPWQGPRANGMPELHKLTPFLGILQNNGQRVALVTDGRMSGASGKVLAAIHTSPEALDDGLVGRIRDGDLVTIDAAAGVLDVQPAGQPLEDREPETPDLAASHRGMGRDLFAAFRHQVGTAEAGASIFEEVR